jgi:hypothetical protein
MWLSKISMAPLYDFAGGLSEFWALLFGITAVVLSFKGKLDGNFALTITALQTLLCAHDTMDDYHERKTREAVFSKNELIK